MIKNIVFDLGNVLIRWNPDYIISNYTTDPIVKEELLTKIFGSPYWLGFDDGSLTREEVVRNIQKTTSFTYRTIIADIIYYWYQHCPVIEGMTELIKDLKEQGHDIYLLSNTNIHFDEYKDTLPMIKYFNQFYISAERNLTKPSTDIYIDFLQRYDLSAEECLFIDDVQANIDGAKEVGIHGYQFDGNVKKLEIFIQDLKESVTA